MSQHHAPGSANPSYPYPFLNRRICVWLVALMTLSSAFAGQAAETPLQFPIRWQKDLQSLLESSATVADIRGQGHDDVIVAGREELFALDGTGSLLWHWRTKGRFMTYPAVLTRPGQSSLIYAADTSGQLACVDGAGKEVWHSALKGPSGWSASVVCVLSNAGPTAVIQTDETGLVWAFDALTGKALWQTQVKGSPTSPAVADLDGDGRAEIVVMTSEGNLALLGADGTLRWQRALGGATQTWATPAPVIFANSEGAGRIVAASGSGEVFCLDQRGETLWQRPTRGAAASTISVGDLDRDGRADVCLVTQTGVIYRFDESGRVLWEIDMQGRSLAPGGLFDVDGDGQIDFVLSTQSGLMLVLNQRGEIRYRWQFNSRTINVTPTPGHLQPGSPALQLLLTGGESGLAYCLGTSATTNAPMQWRAYRCDAQNSGAWLGLRHADAVSMSPVNLDADEVFCGEEVRIAVHNPQPNGQPLTATAVCLRPDGSRQTATTVVLGPRGELVMPVEVVIPGTYHFEWQLENAAGARLVAKEKSVFLQPFANDRALAARAPAAMRAAAHAVRGTLPQAAAALLRDAQVFEINAQELRPLQEAVPGSTPVATRSVLDRTAKLTRDARRGLELARLVQQAARLGPSTSLLPFEGVTWENRRVEEQLPASATNVLQLSRKVVPGEHEPFPLNLLNLTDHELLVRVRIEGATNGIVATAHRSLGVPTSLAETSWDALPELDESATLSIPPLGTREVWLDLDLGQAQPGNRQVVVRFLALNGAGVLDSSPSPHTVPPPESSVQIALQILPFTMVPPGDFRLCTWAAPEAAQLDDLLSHGNNVFTVPYGETKYSAQGQLEKSNFEALDRILTRLRGKDVVLLPNGMPGVHGTMGSAEYLRDLKSVLTELTEHLAGFGIDTNHFALYPFDEPGGNGWNAVNQLVEFGKAVRATHPEIMIYMDGGGELPMFQAMAPYIDIWCPAIYMLPEKTALMDLVRKTGRMLWSYNCAYGFSRPVGPNLKNMNLIADYRAAALFAFRYHSTGIGFWCYNLGGDPWGRIDMEYMLVYPGDRHPVTSRRWEAVREGIEDYRILAALKKALDGSSGGGVTDVARAKIRHLIDVSLPAMLDPSFEEMTRGLGRSVIDASNNDRTMAAFRQEMIECIEAMSPR